MTMTAADMQDMVTKVFKANSWDYDGDYYNVGIRFEDKDRNIGDTCEHSKNNCDRLDERDFPDFDSPEYNDLPEFDGTSAWDLRVYRKWDTPSSFLTDHCYVIAGNYLTNRDDGLDDGEIVIEDAVVIAKIF